MASELEIKLTWENNVEFKMTAKADGGDVVTICEVDENGCMNDIWVYVKSICTKYFDKQMDTIGNAMKAE